VVRTPCALVEVERAFLKLESPGRPLEGDGLRSGSQRGAGLGEIETLHDGEDLSGDGSEIRRRRQISGRTFEEDRRAAVEELEEIPGELYTPEQGSRA
jgi:hypothetical protein